MAAKDSHFENSLTCCHDISRSQFDMSIKNRPRANIMPVACHISQTSEKFGAGEVELVVRP